MLLSDLGVEVINEVGGDPTDDDLVAKIFGYMKAGMRTIPALIRSRMITTRQTFTLPVGYSSYDLSQLSPSFIRERGFWYTDGNNKKVEIIRLDVSQFKQYQDTSVSSKPKYFNISSKTWFVDRLAPAAMQIEVDYFCALTDTITNASIFTLGEDYIELVKCLAKAKYYEYEDDDAKRDANKADAKVYLTELEIRYEEDEQGDFPDET